MRKKQLHSTHPESHCQIRKLAVLETSPAGLSREGDVGQFLTQLFGELESRFHRSHRWSYCLAGQALLSAVL